MVRYEMKYASEEDTYDWLVELILKHPIMFREIYYERQINNIYFDTLDLDNFQANLRGFSNREKTRVRWYGDLFQLVEHPILEIKRKFGMVGDKLSCPLNPFEISPESSWNNILTVQNSIIDEGNNENVFFLDKLNRQVPTIVNSYKRRYFESANGKFRVTIDKSINYYAANSNWFDSFSIREKHLIIEMKYNVEYALDAPGVSDFFPFRLTRNSKYVNGINKIYFNV